MEKFGAGVRLPNPFAVARHYGFDVWNSAGVGRVARAEGWHEHALFAYAWFKIAGGGLMDYSGEEINALVSNQDAILKLAHPQRCVAAWLRDVPSWDKILGAHTWRRLKEEFAKPGALTPDVVMRLANEDRGCRVLSEFVHHTTTDVAGTELGSAYATALHWRQTLAPQPHFVISDELLELLEHTDITDDLPMSVLKLPYPRFYVEFGKDRKCTHRVPNTVSGLHTLEGAYVEEGIGRETGPGLFITFTGSPLGKRNALDDATDSIFLPTDNLDRLIGEQLDISRRHSEEVAASQNMRASPKSFAPHSFSALKLLIKSLLYVGLPETRRELHPEYSRGLKDSLGKKNPAKREKAQRQLRGLSDYILINAPAPSAVERDALEAGDRSGPRAHWRRGHYRLQPHGPQSGLRKVVFIRPLLIAGAQPLDVRVPSYRVT